MQFLYLTGYEYHDDYVATGTMEATPEEMREWLDDPMNEWGARYPWYAELHGPVFVYVQRNEEPVHQPFAGLRDLMEAA